MKVFVTGANGHIGSHTVRFLKEAGHEVVALVRETADTRSIQGLDLTLVKGDVTDAASIDKAMAGCDVVVHLAAVYKTWAQDPAEIVEPAIKGAEVIFKAAEKNGVKRIVYTSSIASVGVSDSPVVRTADQWNEDARNPYYVAKTESEKKARQLADAAGIELVVLCPAMVIGPLDYRITPSTELILKMANFQLPYLMTYSGGTNLVDVRDVAFVHAKAVDAENVAGERFIIGSENVTSQQIGKLIKKLTGTGSVHMPFPRGMMLVSIGAMEAILKVFKIKPLVPVSLVYENIGRWAWYDSEKTYKAFGYKPRGFEESVIASLQWLKEQGKLKQKVLAALA
ncbi:MAG: NAD-dependent epimerase/dehydratase family protein [Pseudomonadales bacterium]|nr:NAD-dependent epimerase/dehydratase family protein [Pseudomonadales bacterium]